jgi:hypothetical protein
MPSDATPAGSPGTSHLDPGLPPVTPPSARIILRDFLVPGLIVAFLVGLFLVGPPVADWLRSRRPDHSAREYLRDLDNANPDIRWRAASDLAQVLLRDDRLAADADFALQLADRLRQARDEGAAAEKVYADWAAGLSDADRAREEKKLEPGRTYVHFLAACLGNFMVPVGAPLLEEMAVQDTGLDPVGLAARRRQAVASLATLGNNLNRFDRLPADQQDAAEQQLEAAVRQGDHAAWARAALDYLRQRRQGRPGALGVDRVLAACAADRDAYLREWTAFALNFWTGTEAENARMEETLVQLSHDAGAGEDELARESEQNREEQTVPLCKKPGFRVQANATIALARRGSPRVRLDLLGQMLDEPFLRANLVLRQKAGGAEQPEEALVVKVLLETLQAVARLHEKRPDFNLAAVRPRIDQLAQNPNPAVRAEAQNAQLALEKR